LNDVLADARTELVKVSANKASYQNLLNQLVLQCLYSLMEPTVVITCRQVDESMVKLAIEEGIKAYKQALGTSIQVILDSSYLPAESAGGVIASAMEGKIRVANTLESRLELLQESVNIFIFV
jgi:V-type H+-transporting ATPase subunit E